MRHPVIVYWPGNLLNAVLQRQRGIFKHKPNVDMNHVYTVHGRQAVGMGFTMMHRTTFSIPHFIALHMYSNISNFAFFYQKKSTEINLNSRI